MRSTRKCALIVAGLALVTLMTACRQEPSAPVQVNQKDSGSTVALSLGQELQVTLESNHTTGYQWAIDGDLPSQLEQVGEPEYTTESTALGAGGIEVWTFKAASAGEGTLSLKYWRSFEPTAPPPDTFDITVNVTE